MNLETYVSPSGRIHLKPVHPGESVTPIEQKLFQQMERSVPAGLVTLASQDFSVGLEPGLAFWRQFSRKVFQSLCQLGDSGIETWSSLPAPSLLSWQTVVEEAPPMVGLEYLTVGLLESLWVQVHQEILEQAKRFPEGPAAFVFSIDPMFHLVGRVHFHLAENKGNPERPFAFLATYTTRLSQTAKVQHLPLAQALKQYAGAGEKVKLEALLEPVRKASSSIPLVRELLEQKALFAPQSWNIAQAYRFLHESLGMEDAGIVVRVPDWWSKRGSRRPEVRVRLGTRTPKGVGLDALMDFEVNLALGDENLTQSELKQLLQSTDGLALLRGKWVEVDREKIQEALGHWKKVQKENPDGISFIQGMRMLSGVGLDRQDQIPEQQSGWTRIVEGKWLEETLQSARDPASSESIEPGKGLRAILRPYQVEGVKWLDFMTRLGLGACLADDMGLGKTIQVIDLLLQMKKRHLKEDSRKENQGIPSGWGPSLLVAPASLLGNWKAEIDRFAPNISNGGGKDQPGLKVLIVHRSELDGATLGLIVKSPEKILQGVDLVVTTYSFVASNDWVEKWKWNLVILDEAQAIKNAGTVQTRAVKKIPCRGRIVLTGTPVENQLGDLWSIFDFCCPGLLGNAAQFKRFVKIGEKAQGNASENVTNPFGALRKLVRPYILRRLKTDPDIVPDLPQKTEMRVDCSLTKKQAVLYAKVIQGLEKSLDSADGMARRGLVLSSLMQLKQICNHPDLYLHGNGFPSQESGKFDRLGLLCQPIRDRQEKVLVFTQFQSMTDPIAGFLAEFFGRPGLVLHGATPVKKRSDLVKQFQDSEGPPFFVISLKAGGSGLNLTAASHVVHFDRWWNPAVENQATDRAFRIGQKRNVMVHKFVCRGTVEERIDKMILDKSKLADQILSEEGFPLLTEMSNKELLAFVSLDISRATED